MKNILWIIVIILAILVGLIPITYLTSGVNDGFLELKSPETLRNKTWWVFLYVHAISGGIAILIGWIQFSKKLLQKRPKLHRVIGKTYLSSAITCSISGFYIGFYATGGFIAAAGFITVACIYFYTTLQGYLTIRKREILHHQSMMTYSYSVCLAAVSLRLSTPLAYLLGFEYVSSYTFIAWSAWIPNLAIAYWINKNRKENMVIEKLIKQQQF
jgi:uncharacterized membrane protein